MLFSDETSVVRDLTFVRKTFVLNPTVSSYCNETLTLTETNLVNTIYRAFMRQNV